MKKLSLSLIALTGLFIFALAIPALAAEKGKVTITGEGKCAKCALHETDKCQNAVQVKEGDKTVTYYLAANKVSKDFHENLCKESQKVTVTGTVKEKDGKKILTASKIELAK
jgi:uncharacterized protein YggE